MSGKRILIAAAVITVSILGLWTVVFSPNILGSVNRSSPAEWGRLSDVGQAYGGISAILTALALIGVAASLLVQRQQANIARTQAIRAFQLQMLTLCLDRPETYYPLMGHPVQGTTEDARRQIFATYFLNYVHAGYSIDLFDEPSLLNDVFPRFFQFDTGRSYWESMRPVWVARYLTRKSRHYVKMLDLSYERAVSTGPPIIATRAAESRDDSRPTTGSARHLAVLGGGLVVGIALEAWRRRRQS